MTTNKSDLNNVSKKVYPKSRPKTAIKENTKTGKLRKTNATRTVSNTSLQDGMSSDSDNSSLDSIDVEKVVKNESDGEKSSHGYFENQKALFQIQKLKFEKLKSQIENHNLYLQLQTSGKVNTPFQNESVDDSNEIDCVFPRFTSRELRKDKYFGNAKDTESCLQDDSFEEFSHKSQQSTPCFVYSDDIYYNSSDEEDCKNTAAWPIRDSLFPGVPPFIVFNAHDAARPFKLPKGRQYLLWKLTPITPHLLRKILLNTGFTLIDSVELQDEDTWLGTWGNNMRSDRFQVLKNYQKFNHFPSTSHLGRKDRFWRNTKKLMFKFGEKEFNFIPRTYILLQELELLKKDWYDDKGCEEKKWIIKPPCSARGIGVKVIDKWTNLRKKPHLVVQRYISKPYLINGNKFDLRLYVLVTSFDPLRFYLYRDGLTRFAVIKYKDDSHSLHERHMHLTNYSVNKKSRWYTANENSNSCYGHKWTLRRLLDYLADEGVNTTKLWRNIVQLIIKTIIVGEKSIVPSYHSCVQSNYNCYELFGIDVLLDEKLKLWLLEVNISPSLHGSSPVDEDVKGPMLRSIMNLAQFHLPDKVTIKSNLVHSTFDSRLYTKELSRKCKNKQLKYNGPSQQREDYLNGILQDLTGDDVRHLTRAEDELKVRGKFERIFPTSETYTFLKFIESKYYNRLFDAWEVMYGCCREAGVKYLSALCTDHYLLRDINNASSSKGQMSD
ncbi:tubulin polyglutamylase TTLL4-like [Agrilus planipennis]|uniref:Tubulin polyglutamylase TTLL4-like n=1 Tax=Agrilus planipennis TaxID=224129 RepID=A0A1W4WGJ1_AGRPL|nr:tubulin polyglutamylase TTLL4-like [Agrilus planipennis]